MDLRIHYREQGAGPPLVLLHSAGTGASQWRGVADRLEGRRRLIMPNLRGLRPHAAAGPGGAAPRRRGCRGARDGGAGRGAGPSGRPFARRAGRAAPRPAPFGETVAGLTLIEPVIVGILHAGLAAGDQTAGRKPRRDRRHDRRLPGRHGGGRYRRGDARLHRILGRGPARGDAIPAAARLPFFARAAKMAADVDLAWADRTGRAAFGALGHPAQILSAERTTPAARDMARRIADAIPGAVFATIPRCRPHGAGHPPGGGRRSAAGIRGRRARRVRGRRLERGSRLRRRSARSRRHCR